MGGLSPIHWLIVLGVGAVVFGGRGKLSSIMGDAAKGIRAFKDGLKDEHGTAAPHTASSAQIVAPVPVATAPVSPTVATAPMVEREDIAR